MFLTLVSLHPFLRALFFFRFGIEFSSVIQAHPAHCGGSVSHFIRTVSSLLLRTRFHLIFGVCACVRLCTHTLMSSTTKLVLAGPRRHDFNASDGYLCQGCCWNGRIQRATGTFNRTKRRRRKKGKRRKIYPLVYIERKKISLWNTFWQERQTTEHQRGEKDIGSVGVGNPPREMV